MLRKGIRNVEGRGEWRARILVADDHEEMRKTIVRLLKAHFDVLAAVADGPAFLDAVKAALAGRGRIQSFTLAGR